MTEEDLNDYNKWLMEVWSNPIQTYIPLVIYAPEAYLRFKKKNLDNKPEISKCEDPMVCLRGCSVREGTCKQPIYKKP